MRKIIVAVVISTVAVSLVGCSNSDGISERAEYKANILEADENTVSASEERELNKADELERQQQYEIQSNINEVINDDIGVPDEDNNGIKDTAELEITGTVDPSKWEDNGTDIFYNGKTFKDLSSELDKINTCFTKDELIAVILKSAGDSELFTVMSEGTDEASETDLSLDDRYDGDANYAELVTKYGEDVSWLIVINKDDYPIATMTGSSKYVLLEGVLGNVVIDISDL